MKVYCLLGWDDIIRETKFEYINRVWCMKIGMALKGDWPGKLPEILMMKGDEDVPMDRSGPAPGTIFVERAKGIKPVF